MKRNVFVFFLFLLFLTNICQINIQDLDLTSSVEAHELPSISGVRVTSRGINSLALDSMLTHASRLTKALQNHGYKLRFIFGETPDWLGQIESDLILREEVIDEFFSERSLSIYDSGATTLIDCWRRLVHKRELKTLAFFVPSKIVANNLKPSLYDARLKDLFRFRTKMNDRFIGSAYYQERISKKMISSGLPTALLLNTYRKHRDTLRPLYPHGDSHWRPEILYPIALFLLKQIDTKFSLPEHCLVPNLHPPIFNRSTLYSGDLADSLKLKPSDSILWNMRTSLNHSSYLPQVDISTICPQLLYAGTSYGTKYLGNGDISQILQTLYRGRVLNISIEGKGPLASLNNIQPDSINLKNSILLWEIPFRSIKYIFLENNSFIYRKD